MSTTEWVPYVQSDQTKSWLSGKKISKLEGLHGRERWEIIENDMTDIQGMNSLKNENIEKFPKISPKTLFLISVKFSFFVIMKWSCYLKSKIRPTIKFWAAYILRGRPLRKITWLINSDENRKYNISWQKVWNLPNRYKNRIGKPGSTPKKNLNSNERCAEKVFYAVLDLSMGRLFCRKYIFQKFQNFLLNLNFILNFNLCQKHQSFVNGKYHSFQLEWQYRDFWLKVNKHRLKNSFHSPCDFQTGFLSDDFFLFFQEPWKKNEIFEIMKV